MKNTYSISPAVKRSVSLLLLIAGFLVSVKAQETGDFFMQVQQAQKTHLQEKLYLHLDKNSYVAGETIWFKIYCTVGVENLLSNGSKVVYVELIGADQRKAKLIKIPLYNGLGVGDIALPDTLTEGSYRLRAYTNWMRNDEAIYFFDRTLAIGNGRSDQVFTQTTWEPTEQGGRYKLELRNFAQVPIINTDVNMTFTLDGKILQTTKVRTDGLGKTMVNLDHKLVQADMAYSFQTNGRTIRKLVKPLTTKGLPDVQLLPEGGKLLAGFENRIAVKVVNSRGLGEKAILVFCLGQDTLAQISTNTLGMGATPIQAPAVGTVEVIARFSDGKQQPVLFPKIYTSGHAVILDTLQKGQRMLRLHTSSDLVKGQQLHVTVQHLGQVFFHKTVSVTETEIMLQLPTTNFPPGVLTCSVLDDHFLPIVERPFFHEKNSVGELFSIALGKAQYGLREQVDVGLQLRQDSVKGRIGAFSATVIHLGKIAAADTTNIPNILTSLLLSADLKGFIERPEYYLDGHRIRTTDLDYLVLTQGWRKSDWSSLATVSTPRFAAEKGLAIRGYLRKLGQKAPVPKGTINLVPSSNMLDVQAVYSDQKGYFEFADLQFPDSSHFMLYGQDAKGKKRVRFEIWTDSLAEVGFNRNWPLEQNDVNRAYQQELKLAQAYFAQLARVGLKDDAILLDEVLVQRKRNKASQRSQNLNGRGNADFVFNAEDFKGYGFLGSAIYDQIGGTFKGWNLDMEWPPLAIFFLDGRILDAELAENIPPDAIESVEVLRSSVYTGLYGVGVHAGNEDRVIFVLTTKVGRGNLAKAPDRYGSISVSPQGLYFGTTYYKPTYAVENNPAAYQDLRTSIHWEPSIVVNKSGKTNFQFFTSDEPGTYRIIVEGLDMYGNLFRQQKDITVKR
ncbi:hypothetical protein [Sphingobacterium sp.]|jgi:hypothetical protein|uniref:hypothetical protein n=1 Tax=Sphingobacterium sp. TaxID=341027 RepID=UPI0028A2A674|nr:hypothetical protein [Sphingobacterium sp.]